MTPVLELVPLESGPNTEQLKDAFFAVDDRKREVPFGTPDGPIVVRITSIMRRIDAGVVVWDFLAQSIDPESVTQWWKGRYRLDMKDCWLEPQS